jgi:hypothetical protein
MIKNLICCSVAVFLTGCAAPPPGGYRTPVDNLREISLSTTAGHIAAVRAALLTETREQVIEKGKAAIANKLKDPSSAQFRNVRLVKYLDGEVICGEINGKNSYGGYVGYSDFVADVNSGQLRYAGKYAEVNASSNAGIDAACR